MHTDHHTSTSEAEAQRQRRLARQREIAIANVTLQVAAGNNPSSLLKVVTVSALTGRCRASILALEKAGKFPKAIRNGTRCTRWRRGDVQAWLDAQAAQ